MSAQWQTGYKSPIIESTGNAFFVKTQENTHAGTKDTLSAQQETREIVCLFYTHLNPVILKKKKRLSISFNDDILYSSLKPFANKINFKALAPRGGKTYSAIRIPGVCLCW